MPREKIDLDVLEPSQFASAKAAPFPRARLGRGLIALLLLLRVYVLLAIPLVGYAFVHTLMASPS
jgi:hypothetical protein